jgi:hypothetical protein
MLQSVPSDMPTTSYPAGWPGHSRPWWCQRRRPWTRTPLPSLAGDEGVVHGGDDGRLPQLVRLACDDDAALHRGDTRSYLTLTRRPR